MNKKFMNGKGFTLIEIIASLVILGVLAATIAIPFAGKVVQGFYWTKMNTETIQKGQIALNRLTNEFTNIVTVNDGKSTFITFTSRSYIDGTLLLNRKVWLSGGNLLIGPVDNGDTLVDNVANFVLTYYDNISSAGKPQWIPSMSREIEFTLSLVGPNNTVSVFTSRILPRNL